MDFKAQSKWRWLIAAYLFLAGLGAGAYAVGVVIDLTRGAAGADVAKIGVTLGLPCVLIGCLFLIADLGSPTKFWRAFMRPGTSWIARGTIIITLFMILDAIHIAFWVWPFPDVLADSIAARHALGIVGTVFAFGTMIYTGILLGANRPIAFWSTAMLPLLFLVSALSTGVMAVVLVAAIAGHGHDAVVEWLARRDLLLIGLEIVVLAFYLQGTHRVSESRASAQLVLTGALAPFFWFGVAILGLLLPLVLEAAGGLPLAVVASLCGLAGGLMLRYVVLAGGIHAPLRAGPFQIALPIV